MPDQPQGEPQEQAAPACYRHPDRETYIRCQRCERPICPECMRQASVGFHCPECVKEGAKQTRQARTAYGGTRVGDATLVSRTLVGLNLAVFLLITATGGARSDWVDRLALLPETVRFGFADGSSTVVLGVGDSVYGEGGAYWQLLTSMFAHVQLLHIGFNLLALWILGPQLELAMGRSRYLALYLISGLSGSACVLWLSAPFSQTLGASGSIYGLLAALLVVALKVRGNVQLILTWIGLNFLITVLGSSFISWQGHLGGFVGGLALALIVVYAPRSRRAVFQWTGIGLVALTVLLLTVTRIAILS